ncbi:MAG TPA: aminotransferase class V-fold PLP-dependent enzyme, partial [Candidatus Eisenbacteria bacterium]
AEAMRNALDAAPANPSSVHAAGKAARRLVDGARRSVAGLVGGRPEEIIFTGSGSEAAWIALHGALEAARDEDAPPLVVSSPIEHAALREPLAALDEAGVIRLTLAPIGATGLVDADCFEEILADRPALVVCQWANNETGVIQPVDIIGTACRAAGVPFLVDAVAAAGRLDLRATHGIADLVVLSSAKLGGPAGVGALWIRPGLSLTSPLGAGGQEQGLRGGTENVIGIVGFGAAAAAAATTDVGGLAAVMAHGVSRVRERVSGALLAGDGSPRLANTAQFVVPHDDEEMLILALDRFGYAVSAGSACAAGAHKRSHVLEAMGLLGPGLASVRVSIGADTTKGDMDDFAEALRACVRAAAPAEAEEIVEWPTGGAG